MRRLDLLLNGIEPRDDVAAVKAATPDVADLPDGFVALIWSRFCSDTRSAQWLPPDVDLLAEFAEWLREEAPGT